MKNEVDLILLLIAMVLLALMSGAYAAMQLLSHARSERNGDEDNEGGRFTDRLADDPVYNYGSLGLGRLAAVAFVAYSAVQFAGHRFASGGATNLLVVVGVCVLVPYVLGTIVGMRWPRRFADLAKVVIYPVIYLFRPVSFALFALLKRISPGLANAVSFPVLPFKKRLELFGYKSGEEDADEQALFESVFEFVDTRVREVMVPRIDMVAVNIHMPAREAVEIIIDAGHSRVPVFDETIDKIVGVIHSKDLLEKMVRNEDFSLAELRRDVYFVPESKMIDELLTEFKKRKMHLAITVDEYGGTAGLITLEDVLEELVGDIQDEFDTEEDPIRRIDEDTVICSSRVRLDDLSEELGLELDEELADTLGGFLYVTIGRVPRVGETITRAGLVYEVQSVVRQRIDKVRISGLQAHAKRVEDGTG
jgi:CBS domain containing-hemolysin-like protein